MKQTIVFLLFAFCLQACESNPADQSGSKEHTQTETDAHNAEHSLDYLGSYEGTFPCDDCEGIVVEITLNADKTYLQTTAYQGNEQNDYEMNGKWRIDKNKLTLTDSTGKKENYFVGENFLQQMDDEGNRMEGENPDEFILKKRTSKDVL